MLRDVNVTVLEGNLSGTSGGTGVHVKIGASPKVSTEPIVIKSSYTAKRIVQELGSCPLADACMDSIENGSSVIYCLPVAPTTAGTVSTVTKTAGADTSTGTVALAGSPSNSFQFVIEVLRDGALNAAVLRWSLNGGLTYSEELTMPTGGSLELAPTGVTATFVAGEGGFKVGDTFKATTIAPTLSNQSILSAIDRLHFLIKPFEFVHVVGGTVKALWASTAVKAAELEASYKKPLFMLFETALPVGTTADYITELLASTEVNSRHIQVSSHLAQYTRMNGVTQVVSAAGIIAGLYGAAKVHQSIGEVKSFAIPAVKMKKLLPEGIEEYTDILDDAGYITLRQYDGLTGYYVNNARMMVSAESDYKYAERVRVINKASREVRKALLPQLQTSVNVTKLDIELAAIAEFARTPLDAMIAAEEISSARIVVPEGQDVITSESLDLEIYIVPVGIIREIAVNLSMENPYRGGTVA